jgi:hypothetical protein
MAMYEEGHFLVENKRLKTMLQKAILFINAWLDDAKELEGGGE